ncbi:MAG: HlyD family efflux transporter periplasmic adaptor subunit [Candidatus Pacebacteria bacterium]|nr:HlyD family efflux transporter periplasmic adaptor subunit [Candidatus Paceibacterota bacterium]
MKQRKIITWFGTFIIIGLCVLGVYLYVSSKYVYIDQSVIEAPIINLSSANSDVLQEVFVKAGDTVTVNEPIARVGDQIVRAKVDGLIVSVNENIGQYENTMSGQATVATMIDPTQLRVVGLIDEDKGLSDIKVGDVVRFTVDTFGSKNYYGVVDELGQTSETSVTNNIFNQRPTNKFNVYVRFDGAKYPELKSGMSARVWVYKK